MFYLQELLEFKTRLTKLGADVALTTSSELPCVLTSQLVRLVTHHYHPVIKDDDIIITADVDAFITTPDILQPLENDASIWIWQHELTQTTGLTFAMSFLGMLQINF